ncbi:MAG TPA: hypothetical protein VFA76_01555 [Terriglobales bacterium]|nr:hypothetical protein [Terriglobales bacterium]
MSLLEEVDQNGNVLARSYANNDPLNLTTWSKAGAVVNCAYYLVAFGAGVWGIWKDKGLVPSEHITAGLVLYLLPVFVIALVDVWLYRKDLPGLTPATQ